MGLKMIDFICRTAALVVGFALIIMMMVPPSTYSGFVFGYMEATIVTSAVWIWRTRGLSL